MLTAQAMLSFFPAASIYPGSNPPVPWLNPHRTTVNFKQINDNFIFCWQMNSAQSEHKCFKWKQRELQSLALHAFVLQCTSACKQLTGFGPHSPKLCISFWLVKNSTALQRGHNLGLAWNKAKPLPKLRQKCSLSRLQKQFPNTHVKC